MAILNGFNINMLCTDGKDCDGNGTWPYHFDLDVKQVSSIDYEVTLEIKRGWTPNHGKALNKHVKFTGAIYVKVFQFKASIKMNAFYETLTATGKFTDKEPKKLTK